MFIASLVWLVMPLPPHWHLVASPVVSWDLFPFSHAVKVNWRSWWLVSLAVSSSYSRNGTRVLMDTHIRMVLDWVAFLLNAPGDLHFCLILVWAVVMEVFYSFVESLQTNYEVVLQFQPQHLSFTFLSSSLLIISFIVISSMMLTVSFNYTTNK